MSQTRPAIASYDFYITFMRCAVSRFRNLQNRGSHYRPLVSATKYSHCYKFNTRLIKGKEGKFCEIFSSDLLENQKQNIINYENMLNLILILFTVLLLGCKEEQDCCQFTDPRDGKTYRTVKMPDGNIWFAENLNYKIETILSNEDDSYLLPSNFGTSGNSWCNENKDSNCEKYGRLYDWETTFIACPTGWHLPSFHDWENLFEAIDSNGVTIKKLKSKTGWGDNDLDDLNGTDDFEFSALPGGAYLKCEGYSFSIDRFGTWWTATDTDIDINIANYITKYIAKDSTKYITTDSAIAITIAIDNDIYRLDTYTNTLFSIIWNDKLVVRYYPKTCGFSVRCVKNK